MSLGLLERMLGQGELALLGNDSVCISNDVECHILREG